MELNSAAKQQSFIFKHCPKVKETYELIARFAQQLNKPSFLSSKVEPDKVAEELMKISRADVTYKDQSVDNTGITNISLALYVASLNNLNLNRMTHCVLQAVNKDLHNPSLDRFKGCFYMRGVCSKKIQAFLEDDQNINLINKNTNDAWFGEEFILDRIGLNIQRDVDNFSFLLEHSRDFASDLRAAVAEYGPSLGKAVIDFLQAKSVDSAFKTLSNNALVKSSGLDVEEIKDLKKEWLRASHNSNQNRVKFTFSKNPVIRFFQKHFTFIKNFCEYQLQKQATQEARAALNLVMRDIVKASKHESKAHTHSLLA